VTGIGCPQKRVGKQLSNTYFYPQRPPGHPATFLS